MSHDDLTLNRRRLAGLATVAAVGSILPRSASAQDAAGTPAATPASGIKTGDVIPPEFVNAAETDWLTENRTMAQDRSVKG
ncbi:MAG TPA: hypothetical protein VFQ54_04760, partial [Thermomicrobiales bacterium]|nr:hypothetical protein [Thermomicrobiales bacterium]